MKIYFSPTLNITQLRILKDITFDLRSSISYDNVVAYTLRLFYVKLNTFFHTSTYNSISIAGVRLGL
jgi:hypothetical protein